MNDISPTVYALAEEIRKTIGAFGLQFRATLETAIKAGGLFRKLKDGLPHGSFVGFVKLEFPDISLRTIETWMKASENPQIPSDWHAAGEAGGKLAISTIKEAVRGAPKRAADVVRQQAEAEAASSGGVDSSEGEGGAASTGASEDEENPAADSPQAAAAAKGPAAGLTDAMEWPIPPDAKRLGLIADAFARRDEVTALMNRVRALKKDVSALKESDPLLGRLVVSQWKADCDKLYGALKFLRPYALCPWCDGDGCRACDDQGWVGEGTWRTAPREMRAAREEPEGDPPASQDDRW